jgi:hypothetical protein
MSSLQASAESCKALENQYLSMRQTVGLDILQTLHKSMAREGLRRHLANLTIEFEDIGGTFSKEVIRLLNQFASTIPDSLE